MWRWPDTQPSMSSLKRQRSRLRKVRPVSRRRALAYPAPSCGDTYQPLQFGCITVIHEGARALASAGLQSSRRARQNLSYLEAADRYALKLRQTAQAVHGSLTDRVGSTHPQARQLGKCAKGFEEELAIRLAQADRKMQQTTQLEEHRLHVVGRCPIFEYVSISAHASECQSLKGSRKSRIFAHTRKCLPRQIQL